MTSCIDTHFTQVFISQCLLLTVHSYQKNIVSDDDDLVVSGWGEVDDMREELLKDWGELLEKWDGREKTRPSKLVNLCRKVIQ